MTEVPTIVSDNIYTHFLYKYKGDRVHAIRARDEVLSFLRLYSKHISEVKPEKATPEYCFGEWCFDTKSRARLFASIYPVASEVIKIPPPLPPVPERIYRYVEFDILFCCYYPKESDDILYANIVYGLIHTEVKYSFKENLKEWADRVTKYKWETVSMEVCRLRHDKFESAQCNDLVGIDTHKVEFDKTGILKIEKTTIDPKKFVNGVRIYKLEEGYV